MIKTNDVDRGKFLSRRLELAYDKSFLYSMVAGYWVDTDGFALSGPGGKRLGEKYPGEFLISSIEQGKEYAHLKRYCLGTKEISIALPCVNLDLNTTFIPLSNSTYIEILLRETAVCRDPWTILLLPILSSNFTFPSGKKTIDYSETVAQIIGSIIPSRTLARKVTAGIIENRSDYALDLFEALYEMRDLVNIFNLPICILEFILEFLDTERLKEHFPMSQLKGYLDHEDNCRRILGGVRLAKAGFSNSVLIGTFVEFDQASEDEIYLFIRTAVLSPVADTILSVSSALRPTFKHLYSEEKIKLIDNLIDICDKAISFEYEQLKEMIFSLK